jgi:hypothetical protein
MHENECIAPAANTNARSIPTDDVVEKLSFMVFVAFYMYVARVRPDATFFLSSEANVLGADQSKSNASLYDDGCLVPVLTRSECGIFVAARRFG